VALQPEDTYGPTPVITSEPQTAAFQAAVTAEKEARAMEETLSPEELEERQHKKGRVAWHHVEEGVHTAAEIARLARKFDEEKKVGE